MRRWIWLLAIPLFAFTPIHWDYSQPENVRDEFRNAENDLQSKQFDVFPTTPALSELRDFQIVVITSNSYVKLMFRSGQDIYAVTVSCVTVKR